ncbi:uncharacterized protein LOC120080345 isoform X2 [Benincasa hispida]|nr:uncharacterized protein LOC120080345 isoform X2 [Benincasa hispida]
MVTFRGDSANNEALVVTILNRKRSTTVQLPAALFYFLISNLSVTQVMASDGLWDVLSNSEVVGITRDTVKDPGMYLKRLAMEDTTRSSNDNIAIKLLDR